MNGKYTDIPKMRKPQRHIVPQTVTIAALYGLEQYQRWHR